MNDYDWETFETEDEFNDSPYWTVRRVIFVTIIVITLIAFILYTLAPLFFPPAPAPPLPAQQQV